jgi:chloramphenicol-sensitive protein RarD
MNSKVDKHIKGMLLITAGYLIWGLLPLYWKFLSHVSSLEILLHRVLWSAVLCVVYVLLSKHNPFTFIKHTLIHHSIGLLILSSLLLSINWLTYIYAVTTNQLLQASMGYFISPLLIVLFGLILFKEKMSSLQIIALCICALAVLYATVRVGKIPFLSIAIGLTFSMYTMCKKIIKLDGIQSLLIDTVLLLPVVIVTLIFMAQKGSSSFTHVNIATDILLIGGGLATFIPLSLYISGSLIASTKSVGFLQFITPIMAFLLGVFIFNEPFKSGDIITFSLIFIGVILYLISLRKRKESV